MLQKGISASLLMLFCLLYSLCPAQKNGFTIKGKIQGVEDNTPVVLYNLDTETHMDTAYVQKGSFVLTGYVNHPTTCWIECKREYAIIQVENTGIVFNSPLKDMRLFASIRGGKEQDLQNELTRLQHPHELIYYSAYDSLQTKKYSGPEHRKTLLEAFNTHQDASLRIYIEFGKRHPNSYMGLDAVYRNRTKIPHDTLLNIYAQLNETFRSSTRGKAIMQFLETDVPGKGKSMVDFTAQTLDGKPFVLSSLKNKYILLNFWSSACVPCRAENKKINTYYRDLEDRLSIVNFSIDKNRKAWEKASQADAIGWTNVSDLEGDAGRIKLRYGVQEIPVSFLIGKDGTIIEKFIGYDDDMKAKLVRLMNGG